MDKTEKDRVAEFLFYLGKGLWKSIPIIGPVIEEVVYSQYKDTLLNSLDTIPNDLLNELLNIVNSIDVNMVNIENSVVSLSDEVKLSLTQKYSHIILKFNRVDESLERIEKHLNDFSLEFPSILSILSEIQSNIGSVDSLQVTLSALEQKRQLWINRISKNQNTFLNNIPWNYTKLLDLYLICTKTIPDCGHKEFRFRLHELEWLGLVEREKIIDGEYPNVWKYRRINK